MEAVPRGRQCVYRRRCGRLGRVLVCYTEWKCLCVMYKQQKNLLPAWYKPPSHCQLFFHNAPGVVDDRGDSTQRLCTVGTVAREACGTRAGRRGGPKVREGWSKVACPICLWRGREKLVDGCRSDRRGLWRAHSVPENLVDTARGWAHRVCRLSTQRRKVVRVWSGAAVCSRKYARARKR